MKRYLLTLGLLSAVSFSFAKKVKFMVDMDTITPNVNGIHITGDFQNEAGFGADWDPATTPMTQQGSTSLYSIVVDIPAFRCYEFKFVNGIFGYEVEFVPWESRVIHNFNDNRWIYIDSLANDTQVVQPVIYGMNAPAGKHLLRFRVDMRNVATISPLGVHVEGAFQGWDMTKTYMHSFDGYIHDYIAYVDTGLPAFQHEYKFINGESSGGVESVPMACANGNSNRQVIITKDSILDAVCFSQCSPCAGNSAWEVVPAASGISVYPNPCVGTFQIQLHPDAGQTSVVRIYNSVGKEICPVIQPSSHSALTVSLSPAAGHGLYFLKVESGGKQFSEKVIIE